MFGHTFRGSTWRSWLGLEGARDGRSAATRRSGARSGGTSVIRARTRRRGGGSPHDAAGDRSHHQRLRGAICTARATGCARGRRWAPARPSVGGVARLHVRRLGAERPQRLGRRRLQRLERARASAAVARRERPVGDVRARPRGRRALQVRDSDPAGRHAREVRSVRARRPSCRRAPRRSPAISAVTCGATRRGWTPVASAASPLDRPMAVYEVHPGSWRRRPDEGTAAADLARARGRAGAVRRCRWASRTSSCCR